MSDTYEEIVYERVCKLAKLSIHSPEYNNLFPELLYFINANEQEKKESS